MKSFKYRPSLSILPTHGADNSSRGGVKASKLFTRGLEMSSQNVAFLWKQRLRLVGSTSVIKGDTEGMHKEFSIFSC